jgi:hypothetical protein
MTPCGHCGAALEPQAWRALELVLLVDRVRVREIVTSWPEGARVEVRRCGCGTSVARRVDAPTRASSAA